MSEIKLADLVIVVANVGPKFMNGYIGRIGTVTHINTFFSADPGYPYFGPGYVLDHDQNAFFIGPELKKIDPLTDDEQFEFMLDLLEPVHGGTD